jgi:hypothetical protein
MLMVEPVTLRSYPRPMALIDDLRAQFGVSRIINANPLMLESGEYNRWAVNIDGQPLPEDVSCTIGRLAI